MFVFAQKHHLVTNAHQPPRLWFTITQIYPLTAEVGFVSRAYICICQLQARIYRRRVLRSTSAATGNVATSNRETGLGIRFPTRATPLSLETLPKAQVARLYPRSVGYHIRHSCSMCATPPSHYRLLPSRRIGVTRHKCRTPNQRMRHLPRDPPRLFNCRRDGCHGEIMSICGWRFTDTIIGA